MEIYTCFLVVVKDISDVLDEQAGPLQAVLVLGAAIPGGPAGQGKALHLHPPIRAGCRRHIPSASPPVPEGEDKGERLISWSAFIRYGILAAVQGLWAGPYLMDVMGLSPVAAGNLLFLLTLGVVIGNPVSGFLSDRVFRKRQGIMVTALAGLSLTLAGLAFVPVGAPLWLLAALFSAFGILAGTGSIPYAHLKELTPPDRSATALTVLNFFAIVGAGVFTQGLGHLMKALYPAAMLSHEAFVAMFVICAAVMAVGGFLYALTRESASGIGTEGKSGNQFHHKGAGK